MNKFLAIILLIGATGCATFERGIALDSVPATILAAAESRVPGLELSEASVERKRGRLVYEVEGKLDGIEYEMEISEDGEILEYKAVETTMER